MTKGVGGSMCSLTDGGEPTATSVAVPPVEAAVDRGTHADVIFCSAAVRRSFHLFFGVVAPRVREGDPQGRNWRGKHGLLL